MTNSRTSARSTINNPLLSLAAFAIGLALTVTGAKQQSLDSQPTKATAGFALAA
ncbi:MAG: hypothetical protein V3V01_18730 [Acidimicrobiales bacterium]